MQKVEGKEEKAATVESRKVKMEVKAIRCWKRVLIRVLQTTGAVNICSPGFMEGHVDSS